MIKVNLLGDSTVIDHTGKYLLMGYIACLLLVCGVSFVFYSSSAREIADLQDESDSLNSRLTGLQKQTKEANDLEAKRTELNQKLAVIARLKKNKLGPVRVLDDLNLAVPTRSWLTQVTEADGKFTLYGRALDNQTVADFMRELEASDYFSNVDLVETNQKYMLTRTGEIADRPAEQRRDGGGNNAPSLPDKWVRIKEFIVETQVNYSGKLVIAEAAEEAPGAAKKG